MGSGPMVTVYSFRITMEILAGIVDPGTQTWAEIEEFFWTNIGTASFGPRTPYFIYPEIDGPAVV